MKYAIVFGLVACALAETPVVHKRPVPTPTVRVIRRTRDPRHPFVAPRVHRGWVDFLAPFAGPFFINPLFIAAASRDEGFDTEGLYAPEPDRPAFVPRYVAPVVAIEPEPVDPRIAEHEAFVEREKQRRAVEDSVTVIKVKLEEPATSASASK